MKYLIFLLLFLSCKNSDDLGGYSINYDSRLDKNIIVTLPDGVNLSYYLTDGQVKRQHLKYSAIIIDSYVSNVNYDSSFIVVEQKPLDSICECNRKCLLGMVTDTINLRSYALCEEALKKYSRYWYWIIDKRQEILYGPMIQKGYLLQKKKLGISLKLQGEGAIYQVDAFK